jgi:hypothetical protein
VSIARSAAVKSTGTTYDVNVRVPSLLLHGMMMMSKLSEISDDDMDHLRAVREHGGGGAAARGAGDQIRGAAGRGGRHLRGPGLLPRPRRLHDRGVHLRQPPHRAPRAGGIRHPRHVASLQADDDAIITTGRTVRAGDGQRQQLRRRGGGNEVLPGARVHAGLMKHSTTGSMGTSPAFWRSNEKESCLPFLLLLYVPVVLSVFLLFLSRL